MQIRMSMYEDSWSYLTALTHTQKRYAQAQNLPFTTSCVLKDAGLLGGVGDEGGFAPNLPRNEEGLRYVVEAITGAGYIHPGEQVWIALDVAVEEFLHDDGYHIDGKALAAGNLVNSTHLGLTNINRLNRRPIRRGLGFLGKPLSVKGMMLVVGDGSVCYQS